MKKKLTKYPLHILLCIMLLLALVALMKFYIVSLSIQKSI